MKKNNKKKRLVVDANIWISALMSLTFRTRIEFVFSTKILLVFSKELLHELDKTVRKPRLARKINRMDYEKLVSELRTLGELVDVHSTVERCRDPEDNYLLALAKDGNADYLITGDKDLLVLKEFGKTKIVTLSEFEKIAAR